MTTKDEIALRKARLLERQSRLSPEQRALFETRLRGKPTSRMERIPRRGEEGPAPLSFAQQRLWFIDQWEPGSPLYNLPAAVRLTGQLDVAALKQSLEQVVRRHDALRTTFDLVDGHPVQIVALASEAPLPLVDLQELSTAKREDRVRQLIAEEAQRSFDLARGPLLRAFLMRLNQDTYVLLINTHHIVSDGWSVGVFIQEMAALYQSFAADRPVLLPELSIQYADFAVWQRQWLQGEVLEAQLAYWRGQLGGDLPVLELPTDRPRQAFQTFRGTCRSFVLPKALSEELKALSQREGVTLFMTLVAAFKVLLHRYTGQTDLLIGSPIANRNRTDIERLIGFFVNTLVLRTDLSDNPPFSKLLKRVQEVALGADAHQDVPFEKLVEELRPERNLSHSPLFQVVFVYQDAPIERLNLPDLTLSSLEVDTGTAKFDLTLSMWDAEQGLTGLLEYNTDLFDAGTMDRLLDHFQTLLEGVVLCPEQRLSDLPLLTKAERHQVLVAWNDTRTDYPRDKCIPELFEMQVEQRPDAVAVVFPSTGPEHGGDQHLTYRELNRRANRLAHYLRRQGCGPEILVGLCVERSVEMIVGTLAILKAGGSYVPLDPAYPKERLTFMLEDTRSPLLLTQQHLVERLPEHGAQVICLDTDDRAFSHEGAANPSHQTTADNLAYVMYTSGSTGRPKGVSVVHRGVVRLVQEPNYASLAAGEIFLQFAPISFDAATLEMWGSLLNGARLVVFASHTPSLEELGRVLLDQRVTILWLTAGLFHLMVDERLHDLEVVQQLLAGGDVLSVPHVRRVLQELTGCRLINGYGPTENTTFTTCHSMAPGARLDAPVPIGTPIANTQVYILDPNLQPVPVGVLGELYIGGDGLARDYLRRPGLTAGAFCPHPFSTVPGARLYRTGDLARYLPDGSIEFLGRIDYQVKVRGFRIELGEIETVLEEHPIVRKAVVLAWKEEAGDKQLVAYLVGQDGQAPVAADLRRFLREKLPEYMVPSTFVTLEAFPLSPTGKVDRRALPAPDRKRIESEKVFVAPRTTTEEVLAGICAQVLGVERVGATDDFFELGGHSLMATQVVSRIRQIFKVELPLRVLFEASTVAGLARRIQAAREVEQSVLEFPMQPIPREGSFPLSFAQQRLWFIDQWEPGNPTYNIPAAVRLTGNLDVTLLERSLNQVVRRHEALRTTFVTVDGQPEQVIAPSLAVVVPVVDLQQLPESERQVQMQRLIDGEARRAFDLTRGPLVRATLFHLREGDYGLLLNMHHIVSDGWSMGILLRELVAIYRAFSVGQSSPFPELPIQYPDFAHWQRQWLQGETLETQLCYWKERLGGDLPVLELPTDRPRPPVQTFQGATYSFTLPSSLYQALQTISNQEGATLFMTLLAAFKMLLSRYTGQKDLVVGSPIANRNRYEIEDLIGFFVNTLALRTDLSGNPTFRELLSQVREVTLGAYAHQDLPFEKLVEELQPARDLSRTPLFQVMFALQNVPMPLQEHSGITFSSMTVDSGAARFDLTLSLWEAEEELSGVLEYNTDLFDRSTMVRLAQHFQVLLESIAADPDRHLADVPILTGVERHQLSIEWNDTQVEYSRDRCVHELFEAQMEHTPDAVALVSEDCHLTYRELNRRANCVAHHLQRLDVGPEVVVGVCGDRSPETVTGILGIVKAGGAYLPLDPTYPQERLAFVLQDAQVSVLLTQRRWLDRLAPFDGRIVSLDTDWDAIASGEETNPIVSTMAERLAYVIYTSGSTGRPKGVQLQHNGLVNLVCWHQQAFAVSPTDRTTQVAGLGFDACVWEMWAWLVAGASLHFVDDETRALPVQLQAWLLSRAITFSFLPTPLLESVLPLSWPPKTTLCALLTGGDKLHLYPGHSLPFALVNNYGPTEDTVITTSGTVPPQGLAGRAPSIGRPIANTQVYLLDAHLQPVPVGVPGELCIGGDGLSRGYLNRPDLTAESFVPHPFAKEPGARLYRTGDLARYLPDGSIEFLGRIDHQAKLRGFRIELGEIEAILGQHSAVQTALVLVQEDGPGTKRLVAYVVPQDKEKLVTSKLRAFLQERLPDYMVPAAFVVLEAMPLTPHGKVDRRALPIPEPGRAGLEQALVLPRTPVEELLAGIWARILGIERLGIHDNFFELGGHSLLATQILSQVRDAFQVEMPLRILFEAPTVAGLTEWVERAKRDEQELKAPPIERVARDGELPLSFAQQRLWFLDQFEPGDPTYNLPVAVRLTGQLDVAVLACSLDEVVQRHEALRTTFSTRDGRPVQTIAPALIVGLPVVDLQALPASEREIRAQRLIDEEVHRPFDLACGPLMRTVLLRLEPTEHVLLLNTHHIISDGWSTGVLIRELTALYQAFSSGESSPLPELPIQYIDFAMWQRAWLQGQVRERQLSYWRQQLGGDLEALELPTDWPRPPVQTHCGATVSSELPAALSQRLQDLSQQEGVTLFMTLLAAFKLLLHRYTGQTDILVGAPIAGRTRSETEGLIGFFLNTLVLRTDLSGDPGFRELLNRVRDVTLGAYAHQDLPFEDLLEALQPERDLSRTPLFQVFFNMLNIPGSEVELPGLVVEALPLPDVGSKFDLTLYVGEQRGSVRFDLVYNADLFAQERMVEMLGQFEYLLAQIVENPAEVCAHFSLVTPAAEKVLPNPSLAQHSDWQGAVHTLIAGQAQQAPEQVAVVDEQESWTYRELDEYSSQLAHYLRDSGIQPQEVVAIYGHRSASLVWAVLGVLKAGAAFVILDPVYPAVRLVEVLRQAKPQGWLQVEEAGELPGALAEFVAALPCRCRLGLPRRTMAAAQNLLADYPVKDPAVEVSPDDLACVAFTSGSTGQPKGILGRQGPLSYFLPWQKERFDLRRTDRYSMLSGLSHDPLQRDIFTSLVLGATLCIPDSEQIGSPGWLVAWMRQQRITVAHLTPAMLQLLTQTVTDGTPIDSQLPSLRYALIVGDVLTKQDVARLHQLAPGVTCVNLFGTTETQRAVGYFVVPREEDEIQREILPLGQGIPDVQLLILNAAQQLAGIGELSEICVRSPHLARGYLDDETLTRERFIINPFTNKTGDRLYRTGDLGRYQPDGNVVFQGRADHQVKVRGFRIELGEVEAALSQHPAVRETAVLARDADRELGAPAGRRLVAYVVPHDEQEFTIGEMRRFLREKLPEYMIPSALVTLEALPLTPNRKVDRRALPTPDRVRPELEQAFVAPRTPIEEKLADIWVEILDLDQVGVQDNFFELGGHSLLATQVVSHVRQTFQVELPLRELFESPTIAGIAAAIDRSQDIASVPKPPAIGRVSRDSYRVQAPSLDEISLPDVLRNGG